jgi:tight adherence protein B
MEAWIVCTLAFCGAFLAVVAANAILADRITAERRRLNHELQEQLRQRQRERLKGQDLSQLARLADRPRANLREKLAIVIDQSGVDVTVRKMLTVSAASALAAAAIGGCATASIPLGAIAGLVGALLPLLYVLRARQRRLAKLLAQVPGTFELMSRVLRSGQTLSQAMQLVANDCAAPISLEFNHCYEQMNLGLSADVALRDLARRTGLLELKIFAVAVLVQRQTGGNLSELFDKMGTVVRERFRIKGMINSLTAQGRMQGVILLSLPVGMFALLMVIQPSYESVLLDYPWLIAAALGLMALGGLWISRVVHFDF